MSKQFERRSLELTPAQWAALELLAVVSESLAPAGPTAGKPSWRTFVKRLANEELAVISDGAPRQLLALKEQGK